MSTMFTSSARGLQERFDTRRLADRIEELLVHDWISPDEAEFIEARDMFFLATADEQGNPNCSYKGGDPGFVRVLDQKTLAFPSYNGNGMFLSGGNMVANPSVGMLFVDFERGSRMRVNGEASVVTGGELLDAFPEAQFVVRVAVREVFPNCPRYIHRMHKVDVSPFVPRADCVTPVPGWKRSDWARDVLPADDPANSPDATVL